MVYCVEPGGCDRGNRKNVGRRHVGEPALTTRPESASHAQSAPSHRPPFLPPCHPYRCTRPPPASWHRDISYKDTKRGESKTIAYEEGPEAILPRCCWQAAGGSSRTKRSKISQHKPSDCITALLLLAAAQERKRRLASRGPKRQNYWASLLAHGGGSCPNYLTS